MNEDEAVAYADQMFDEYWTRLTADLPIELDENQRLLLRDAHGYGVAIGLQMACEETPRQVEEYFAKKVAQVLELEDKP